MPVKYISSTPPPVAYAAVCSIVMVMMLNHCFMYLPLFVGVLCWVFVFLCITFCHHFDEKERDGCFALVASLCLIT